MVTRSEAIIIAIAHLKRMSELSGVELQLMDEQMLERDCGWVFFYNSRAYLSPGDANDQLAGNAPFIVDRRDGAIHETGTARSVDYYVKLYESSGR